MRRKREIFGLHSNLRSKCFLPKNNLFQRTQYILFFLVYVKLQCFNNLCTKYQQQKQTCSVITLKWNYEHIARISYFHIFPYMEICTYTDFRSLKRIFFVCSMINLCVNLNSNNTSFSSPITPNILIQQPTMILDPKTVPKDLK